MSSYGDNNRQVLALSGTAALPGHSFLNATKNGMYLPTTNSLGLSTNGTNALYIDASQNVGIGTTSPSQRLTISDTGSGLNRDLAVRNGDATNYHQLAIGYNASTLNSGVPANSLFMLAEKGGGYGTVGGLSLGTIGAAPTVFINNGAEAMRIDSSGNVGIGTSSLSYKLHVYGNDASQIRIGVQNTNATGAAEFIAYASGLTGSPYGSFSMNSNSLSIVNSSTTLATTFALNGSERMRIDSSGNVGIGTTSPNAKLNVYSASSTANLTQWNGGTSDTNFITIAKSGTTGSTVGTPQFSLGMDYSTTYVDLCAIKFARDGGAGGNMQFFTGVNANGTERMRIDSSGNLLVGTTTSLIGTGGCVQAVGATTNRGYLVMGRATASTSGVCGSLIAYNATNTIASFDFQANGANNSGLIQAFTFSAGSAVQGPYVNTGGTSWTTASDENLKDIIEPVENGVEKLSSLRSIIGKFKTDHDDVRRVFLIAQDVQKVLPEAICTDPNGYLGLNYQDLIPVLVKAIQELSAKVTALESK